MKTDKIIRAEWRSLAGQGHFASPVAATDLLDDLDAACLHIANLASFIKRIAAHRDNTAIMESALFYLAQHDMVGSVLRDEGRSLDDVRSMCPQTVDDE